MATIVSPAAFTAALLRYTGTPYVFGGKTAAGIDCSGLITLALADVGVPFVHGSAQQIAACEPISVAEAWATPGALLYRPGHDAISLGDGRAIEAIRPHVQITPRTDTYQGAPRFTRAGLIPGIHYDGGSAVAVPRMVSPTEGRYTSAFNYSRRIAGVLMPHAGIDIAPPTPGDSGRAVYAVFAGTVTNIVHGRYLGQPASSGTVVAPGRSGNGLRVRNPDGEQQIFIHVNAVVKDGQRVQAGDLIGYTDRSGIQTGPHLHFETWNAAGKPYDPAVLFKKYGVAIGSRPAIELSPNPPKKTPSATDVKDWLDMATQKEVEDALWNVLNRQISVGGDTAKRHGKTAPLYALIRDGAYALDEIRDTPRRVWMYELKVGGATAKAIGKTTTNAISALRYAAGAVFDSRPRFASILNRLKG